ncbi:MAG TPA: MarR family transcriptional regulator [Thermoleophilia bacterium]|nr:MarR family transcriptional regulator [Thermoleophilia bacterium]
MADDKDRLIDEVDAELNELRRTADRLDEVVAAQFGVNRTDLRCLGILYRRGRVTAGQLAEESGLTPGAITTVLDRLERSGYANRVADPTDRRRVLVTSTVATRELGARVFGELELASRARLEPLDEGSVELIRDYLKGIRDFYGELVDAAATTAADSAAQTDATLNEQYGAPLDGVTVGRLEFTKGWAKVTIGTDPSLTELYRAEFEGGTPDVRVEGGLVSIGGKRRFRPFDWRGAASDIWLTDKVPWKISMKGGMWELRADLRGLELRELTIGGGASDVEVWLPAPTAIVPVRVSGGASHVRLHRPKGTALRAEVTGGASQLVFDGQSQGAVGGRNHLESAGFAEAHERYEVRFSGGASQLEINTI